MADDEMEEIAIGPSGPDGQWQAGDYIMWGMRPAKIDAEGAQQLNESLRKRKEQAAIVEMTRTQYQVVAVCPKCRLRHGHETEFKWENADCGDWHGKSEHFDRHCLRCGFIWPENLPSAT